MKKITILVPDKTSIGDLSALMDVALEFKMENVPEAKRRSAMTPHTKHVDRSMTTINCVLGHYTPEGVFTKELVAKWLMEKSFAPTSSGPAITSLRRSGNLVDVGPGKYKWLKG